jgi:hypothetical protein
MAKKLVKKRAGKSIENRGVAFYCKHCHAQVAISILYFEEKGKALHLFSNCGKCDKNSAFSMDEATAILMGGVLVKSVDVKRVH